MHRVKSLLEKLKKFYWSELPPEHYVLTIGNTVSGIGLVAHKDYAAFNPAFSYLKNPSSMEDHREAVSAWAIMSRQTSQVVGNATLGDRLALLDKQEFHEWYKHNRGSITAPAVRILDKALEIREVR